MEPDERSAADALLEHRGFVRALAERLVDGAAGEDLAQDALLAGLSQPPRHERAWRTWLRSTVRHLASNLVRTRRRVDARERAAARPEALPSTAALVVRLELEQRVVAAVLTLPEAERAVVLLHFYDGQESGAIAAKLRVPADTVRARLRRALARLRAVLDRDCGDRGTWVRGLAPLLGWKALPLPVGATPIAATGVEVGAAIMGVKSVAMVIASAAAVTAACWLLPDRTAGARRSPDAGASHAGAADVASGAQAADPAPATVVAEPAVERRSVAAEVGADDLDGFMVRSELPPPGEVTFRVVDARTRAPLDAVTVRFQSDRRFAQYEGGGEGRARLTAGAWTGRAIAAGHEPLDLGGFDVVVGEVRELGTLELFAGGGCIEGRVTARHVLDASVRVELFGDGRAPCDECRPSFGERRPALDGAVDRATPEKVAGPTLCCGFEPGVSSFALADGGRFSFRNLAAGVYWLRAFDPQAQLVDLRRVELARNGALWIDLDVTRCTTLAVELRHPDGHRFTGAWAHPHRAVVAPIRFAVAIEERALGVASAIPAAEEVCATIGPPIPIDGTRRADARAAEALEAIDLKLANYLTTNAELREFVAAAHSRDALRELTLVAARLGSDRLDRDRTGSDSLAGEAPPPQLTEVALPVVQERPDRFVVGALPRELVTVRVTCGPFASDAITVDLRHGFTGPLVVTLAAVAEGSAGAVARGGVAGSCTACHGGSAQEQAALLTDVFELQREQLEARAAAVRADFERAATGER